MVASALMSLPTPTRCEIKALTGVRFWLAPWVIFYHQTVSAGWVAGLQQWPVWRFLSQGYLAVSGFFCLSGFILACNYHGRMRSAADRGHFLGARLARIYPVYTLGLVLMLPIVALDTYLGRQTAGTAAVGLISSVTLSQSFFPQWLEIWNGPGWSLSCEFYFYLTLPLYAVRLERQSGLALAIGLAAAIGVTWLLNGLAVHWAGGAQAGAVGSGELRRWAAEFILRSPLTRAPEFVAGYIAGEWYARRGPWSIRTSQGAVVGGLILLLAGCWLTPADEHLSGLFALPFLLIIFGLANPGRLGLAALGNPAACFLGEASYGLYIFHEPLARYFSAADGQFFHGGLRQAHPWLLFAVYFAGVLGLAALILKAFEQPLRQKLASRLGEKFGRWLGGANAPGV